MKKILLAEDDANLGLLLQEYLTLKGFETTLAKDGDEALNKYLQSKFDLCIFDVMMPKKDGFVLAKEVRMSDNAIPIIFLTAKAMKEDTLHAFKLGADDYMTKPFLMEELLARISAVLRRSQFSEKENIAPKSTFQIRDFNFDASKQTLELGGVTVKLTSKEAGLLQLLCENINQTVTRSYALKKIWGDDTYFNARSMDVYVTKLRKYLKEDPQVQLINHHGEGFKLSV